MSQEKKIPNKLNDKKIRFIEEYLIDGDGKNAAVRAGYSAKTAAEQASRILNEPKVIEEIKRRQEELRGKTDFTRERLLQEYTELLNSCKKEGLDGGGTIKDRTNWNKALAQIAKLLGLDAADKSEVNHTGNVIINYKKPGE